MCPATQEQLTGAARVADRGFQIAIVMWAIAFNTFIPVGVMTQMVVAIAWVLYCLAVCILAMVVTIIAWHIVDRRKRYQRV